MKTIKNQKYNQLFKNRGTYQNITSSSSNSSPTLTAIKALKNMLKYKVQEQAETNQKHIASIHKKCLYFLHRKINQPQNKKRIKP